ncbi:MAG TPA: 3-deoxy-7-phosphoheptulonate synthase [Acidobacteriaceae bacterium]|jgi:3-deoxy-7-phosphoheptulonate synthase|nr:3-deoxy-7-phosphoheptulonate synthase [Acidobacteriaceae bacterium]
MIVAMASGATEENIQNVIERMVELGFNVHRTTGAQQTILAGVGTPSQFEVTEFKVLSGVHDAYRISSPYKLAGRSFRPEGTTVKFKNGVVVGGNQVTIMAGPCSVESREQILLSAKQVAATGAQFLRGGAFKPRSSPYSFQGMGLEGLKLLREVAEETGLLVITEVMEISQIELMLPYIDCFQVGARNMQNFNLLRELGHVRKPVLMKRGIAATIEEVLLSAEYILAGGNYDLMLCERGIRTFETYTRNTMDISAIPVLKKLTHLPVLGDPSHGVGIRDLVPPLALAAVAAGADGLLMEMHPNPDKAMSDGAQSLRPEQLEKLVGQLKLVAQAVGRTVA